MMTTIESLSVTDMVQRGRTLAKFLLGTKETLTDWATDEELSDKNFCEELEATVAHCDACGLWVEADDMWDDESCSECANG